MVGEALDVGAVGLPEDELGGIVPALLVDGREALEQRLQARIGEALELRVDERVAVVPAGLDQIGVLGRADGAPLQPRAEHPLGVRLGQLHAALGGEREILRQPLDVGHRRVARRAHRAPQVGGLLAHALEAPEVRLDGPRVLLLLGPADEPEDVALPGAHERARVAVGDPPCPVGAHRLAHPLVHEQGQLAGVRALAQPLQHRADALAPRDQHGRVDGLEAQPPEVHEEPADVVAHGHGAGDAVEALPGARVVEVVEELLHAARPLPQVRAHPVVRLAPRLGDGLLDAPLRLREQEVVEPLGPVRAEGVHRHLLELVRGHESDAPVLLELGDGLLRHVVVPVADDLVDLGAGRLEVVRGARLEVLEEDGLEPPDGLPGDLLLGARAERGVHEGADRAARGQHARHGLRQPGVGLPLGPRALAAVEQLVAQRRHQLVHPIQPLVVLEARAEALPVEPLGGQGADLVLRALPARQRVVRLVDAPLELAHHVGELGAVVLGRREQRLRVALHAAHAGADGRLADARALGGAGARQVRRAQLREPSVEHLVERAPELRQLGVGHRAGEGRHAQVERLEDRQHLAHRERLAVGRDVDGGGVRGVAVVEIELGAPQDLRGRGGIGRRRQLVEPGLRGLERRLLAVERLLRQLPAEVRVRPVALDDAARVAAGVRLAQLGARAHLVSRRHDVVLAGVRRRLGREVVGIGRRHARDLLLLRIDALRPAPAHGGRRGGALLGHGRRVHRRDGPLAPAVLEVDAETA